MTDERRPPRRLQITLTLLAAALVAAVAAGLTWADGGTAPAALLTAGCAFAGATSLALSLARFLDRTRS
jgi:hypothetical protein